MSKQRVIRGQAIAAVPFGGLQARAAFDDAVPDMDLTQVSKGGNLGVP